MAVRYLAPWPPPPSSSQTASTLLTRLCKPLALSITQRLQDVRLLPIPAALDPAAVSTMHRDWGAPEPCETPAPGALGAHLPPVMPLFQRDLGHQNLWPAEKSWGGTGSTQSSPGSG